MTNRTNQLLWFVWSYLPGEAAWSWGGGSMAACDYLQHQFSV